MARKKIVCLGGGSTYFCQVLGDLVVAEGLAGSEITLYDIDQEKAELMARLARRLAEEAGTGFRVRACTELAEAVDGADFAISSIGGMGKSGRDIYGTSVHRGDLLIPARYGIFQIVGDTGGPAGMMMGLRSIPIYLNICREMEKRCPEVVFLNHSNPMAILCRAMIKYTGIKHIIGICHGVQEGLSNIASILEVPVEELNTIWIGTNHYYWFMRVRHLGQDVYPELRRRMATRTPPEGEVFSSKLSEIYQYQIVYPQDDHALEFYPFLAQVSAATSIPYGLSMRRSLEELETGLKLSEVEQQARREAELIKYAKTLEEVTLPENVSSPFIGEGIASLIEAIATGRRQVHIVNIPNNGAVLNLPEYAVLEVEGVTDSCGVRGICTGMGPPLTLKGILEKRIAWQELVVDAGVTGDRNLALQALLLDEMAILPEKAEAMLDELLANSKNLLPQFD